MELKTTNLGCSSSWNSMELKKDLTSQETPAEQSCRKDTSYLIREGEVSKSRGKPRQILLGIVNSDSHVYQQENSNASVRRQDV